MWYIDPHAFHSRGNEMLITTFTNEWFTDWNFKYSPKLFTSSLFSISKYIKDPHAPNIYTHCTNHVSSSYGQNPTDTDYHIESQTAILQRLSRNTCEKLYVEMYTFSRKFNTNSQHTKSLICNSYRYMYM